jgi:hypothetical protein
MIRLTRSKAGYPAPAECDPSKLLFTGRPLQSAIREKHGCAENDLKRLRFAEARCGDCRRTAEGAPPLWSIRPPGSPTTISTFSNEIVMLIEQLPSMPELIDDIFAWRPTSYQDYFTRSVLPGRGSALEAPPSKKQGSTEPYTLAGLCTRSGEKMRRSARSRDEARQ